MQAGLSGKMDSPNQSGKQTPICPKLAGCRLKYKPANTEVGRCRQLQTDIPTAHFPHQYKTEAISKLMTLKQYPLNLACSTFKIAPV